MSTSSAQQNANTFLDAAVGPIGAANATLGAAAFGAGFAHFAETEEEEQAIRAQVVKPEWGDD